MPELPEVETVARSVQKHIHGDRVVDVWVSSYKKLFKTSVARFAHGLEQLTFLSVYRVGKHIVCDLGERENSLTAQWIVHLGMTGRLLVTTSDAEVAKHTHVRMTLASGRELRFVDPRRFGRLEFRDLQKQARFQASGAEPLTISATEFAALFRKRKLAIKAALLNQKLLSGVGNIYADESLFDAGIRPLRAAGKLTGKELEKLRVSVQKILKTAIKLGGSSISDYVDASGEKGFFQLHHKVYMRTGEPCLKCKTPIQKTIVGGRGTHYCPKCQR